MIEGLSCAKPDVDFFFVNLTFLQTSRIEHKFLQGRNRNWVYYRNVVIFVMYLRLIKTYQLADQPNYKCNQILEHNTLYLWRRE